MKSHTLTLLFALAALAAGAAVAQSPAQALAGTIGSSSKHASSWMLLTQPQDFKEGDRLKIMLGGTAKKVLVRLLPKGESPDGSAGVVATVDVRRNEPTEVTLFADHSQITQISVHGGANPFGEYALGDDNGPVTISYIAVARKK